MPEDDDESKRIELSENQWRRAPGDAPKEPERVLTPQAPLVFAILFCVIAGSGLFLTVATPISKAIWRQIDQWFGWDLATEQSDDQSHQP